MQPGAPPLTVELTGMHFDAIEFLHCQNHIWRVLFVSCPPRLISGGWQTVNTCQQMAKDREVRDFAC